MTLRQHLVRAVLNGLLSFLLLGAAWVFWASKESAYKPVIAFALSALFGNTAINHTQRYRQLRKKNTPAARD